MAIRRTTLAADRDDLALLQGEAQRRGVSLAHLLRELVARDADELRVAQRPRFGVVRTRHGAAEAAAADEHAPIRNRSNT
jgi:hypothetical protein